MHKLRRASRWLRDRFRPHEAVILAYHRVTSLDTDPWALAVSPGHFQEQLAVLKTQCRVLSLEECLRNTAAGRPGRPTVVVTFDDGYADNCVEALPLLEEYEVPATIFVVNGAIGSAQEMWWDELERILLLSEHLPGELTLHIDGAAFVREVTARSPVAHNQWRAWDPPPTVRHALYRELHACLQSCSPEGRRAALLELKAWAGQCDEPPRASHRMLSAQQLGLLARHPLTTIGAHTRTHPVLSLLGRDQQIAEIVSAKTELECMANREVHHFAYPFGRKQHYSDAVRATVAAAGFRAACVFDSGRVGPASDRLELPRCGVADWNGEEFEKQLWRWFRN